jgi:hypothetical protein
VQIALLFRQKALGLIMLNGFGWQVAYRVGQVARVRINWRGKYGVVSPVYTVVGEERD